MRPGYVAPRVGDELVGLRSARSKTFERSDGLLVTKVWRRPVHFRGAGGAWRAYDSTLERDGQGMLRNRAGDVQARVAEAAAGGVRLTDRGRWASFALRGATGRAQVSGNTARFDGVLPGVDATYEVLDGSIKETLTLADARAGHEFSFDVDASIGLKPRLTDGRRVEFVDGDGVVRFTFGAPFMADAAGEVSHEVRYELAETAAGWRLSMVADRGWLAAPGRAWPVKLDPTEYTARDRGCEVASGASSATSSCDAPMRIGVDDRVHRALLHFELGSIKSLIGANVVAARVQAMFESQSASSELDVDAHELLEGWDDGVTWDTRDGTTAWTQPGGTHRAQVESRFTVKPEFLDDWISFGVGRLAQAWIDGSVPNRGVLLKARDESAATNVITIGDNPHVEVWHAPRAGVTGDMTVVPWALTDRQSLGVNVANGNAVLRAQDARIAGTGLDFAISRTYNSRQTKDGELGPGWELGAGFDVRLDRNWWDESRTLHMGDGRAYRFDAIPGGDRYRAAEGLRATLVENADDTHTLTFQDSGLRWEFDAFEPGFLERIVDRNGHEIEWNYDDGPDPHRAIDTQGRRHEWTAPAGEIEDVVDSAGRVYDYDHDAEQRLASYSDPDGETSSYGYDPVSGELSSITDPEGHRTEIGYHSGGYFDAWVHTVRRVMDPSTTADDELTTFEYAHPDASVPGEVCDDDEDKLRTEVTGPRGNVTTYCSNAKAQVTETRNALDQKVETSFTPFSNVAELTDTPGTQNAATTMLDYDFTTDRDQANIDEPDTFNLLGGEGNEGQSFGIGYGGGTGPLAKYRPADSTDSEGNRQFFGYDTAGNMTSVRDDDQNPKNRATLHYTDASDAPTPEGLLEWSEDGNQHRTDFTYDTDGNLTKVDPPLAEVTLGSTTFTYDGLSRVTTVTDGKGQVRTLTYDGADRVTRIDLSDGSWFAYDYDGSGNLISRTDSAGHTSTYGYDEANRIATETFPTGTNSYGYDLAGNLASLTDGGGTTSYSYDAINRVSEITDPDGTPVDIDYDDTGDRRATITRLPGNLNETGEVNGSGQLKKIEFAQQGVSNPLRSLTYNYLIAGEHTSKIASITNEDDETTSYSYADPVGRLTQAETRDAGGNLIERFAYEFDNAGNRTQRTITHSDDSQQITSYKHNAANQLCWRTSGTSTADCDPVPSGADDFDYDPNGNETTAGSRTAGYDILDRLSSLNGDALDYLSPTNAEPIAHGTTTFHHNALGTARRSDGGATWFIREPDGTPLLQRASSTDKQYLLQDHLGSTIALADGGGNIERDYSYTPDGEYTSTGSGAQTRLNFAGALRITDDNGYLYHFAARFYDPRTARWTQQDPLNQLADLRQANRYTYAASDPLNLTDPSGKCVSWFTDVCDPVIEGMHKTARALHDAVGAAVDWYQECDVSNCLTDEWNCATETFGNVTGPPWRPPIAGQSKC